MNAGRHDEAPLREAFAALADGESPPGEREFEPAEVWAASAGKLDAARTRELLDLAVRDAECAEAWRLALELRRARESRGAGGSVGRRSPAGRWLAAAAAAAAVLLAALMLPGLLERRGPEAPVFREGERLAIESLLPAEPLPRDTLDLAWSAGPAGTVYDVEVVTGDLDVLHVARGLTGTTHRVPAAALASVEPGGVVLWRVRAILPDGSRVESPVFRAVVE